MSAVNYKPGDKVRVIDSLDVNKIYGGWNVTDDMEEQAGKVFTIKSINTDQESTCGSSYRLEEYSWGWTDEMLEPAILTAEIDKSVQNDEHQFFEVPMEHLLNLYKS